MENYRYISEPKKPVFPLYKVFIYLSILIFNLWSFDTFAGLNYKVIPCFDELSLDQYKINNSHQNGVTTVELVAGDSFISAQTGIEYGYLWYKRFSSRTSYYFHACPLAEPEPDPKPEVVETCDYGSSIEEMLPSISGQWSEGLFDFSGVSYKYKIETETDIKYACDILHRYDVVCWDGNFAAAATFDINSIKDYPKYQTGIQLAYQGCLYDALLTSDFENKWTTECYNATFVRTDTPADQVGNVDFSSYSCVEKTCENGEVLNSDGVCHLVCPDGLENVNGVCVQAENTGYGRYVDQIYVSSHWLSNNQAQLLSTYVNTFPPPTKMIASQAGDYGIAATNYICSAAQLDCPSIKVIYYTDGHGAIITYKETGTNASVYVTLCSEGVDCRGDDEETDNGETDNGETENGGSSLIDDDYILLKDHLNSNDNPANVDLGVNSIGFYELEYPKGFDDVLEKHADIFENSALKTYTDSWTQSVSGNISLPNLYQMCFDLSPIFDLGCHAIPIDSRVFPFVRVILIFSSILLARKITLGG